MAICTGLAGLMVAGTPGLAMAATVDETLVYPDPSDPSGNTGDNGAPLPEDILISTPNAATAAAKLQSVANMKPYVVAEIAGLDEATLEARCVQVTDSDDCGSNVPPARATVAGYKSYMQTTSYTCAPTSARSVLNTMAGLSLTESQLKSDMKTSSARGTYWANISPVMNRYQNYDDFIGEPEHGGLTPEELMARVVWDVSSGAGRKHGTILNVDQSRLAYWNRTKPGRHYLTAYGYDNPAQTITLLDPAGGHYGTHVVKLTEAHTAVVANKGLVIY